MAKGDVAAHSESGEQNIEQLQQRYQKLLHTKMKAEANRDAAANQLSELKTQAREKYATDDLAALENRLARIIEENKQKRLRYQHDLDAIEKGLAEVEAKFSERAAK